VLGHRRHHHHPRRLRPVRGDRHQPAGGVLRRRPRHLRWFTENLFTPSDPKIAEAINDGLAALIWVVLGNVVSKLIVRLAPEAKARA
jgi:hypothetical protein